MEKQLTLSDIPLLRTNDHLTSIEAAESVCHIRSKLHEQIIETFRTVGPLTDEQLECLSEFQHYGPSTIRKRRSELYKLGLLKQNGFAFNSRGRKMIIFELA